MSVDQHQRSNTTPDAPVEPTGNVNGSTTSHDVEWRSSSSPTDVHTQGGTSKGHHEHVLGTCRILQVASHPLALARAIHFIFKH